MMDPTKEFETRCERYIPDLEASLLPIFEVVKQTGIPLELASTLTTYLSIVSEKNGPEIHVSYEKGQLKKEYWGKSLENYLLFHFILIRNGLYDNDPKMHEKAENLIEQEAPVLIALLNNLYAYFPSQLDY